MVGRYDCRAMHWQVIPATDVEPKKEQHHWPDQQGEKENLDQSIHCSVRRVVEVVEEDRRGKHQAIQTVQHTAMTGNKGAAILDIQITLNR